MKSSTMANYVAAFLGFSFALYVLHHPQPGIAEFAASVTSRTTASVLQGIAAPQSRPVVPVLGVGTQDASTDVRRETSSHGSAEPAPQRPTWAWAGSLFLTACALLMWRRPSWALAPVTGVVKWFNSTKGYGFITPDDGSADVFVHQSAINSTGFRTLDEGARVEFDVTTENGRMSAANVSAPGGAPIESSSRGGGGKGGGKGGGYRTGGKGGQRQSREEEW